MMLPIASISADLVHIGELLIASILGGTVTHLLSIRQERMRHVMGVQAGKIQDAVTDAWEVRWKLEVIASPGTDPEVVTKLRGDIGDAINLSRMRMVALRIWMPKASGDEIDALWVRMKEAAYQVMNNSWIPGARSAAGIDIGKSQEGINNF